MGTKRNHSQMSADSPTEGKRNRTEGAGPISVNPLKKRVRDLTRLLEHADNMPADVRMENERALSAHRQELAAAKMEKLKASLSKRYHMVKFFGTWDTIGWSATITSVCPLSSRGRRNLTGTERRKVNRRLKQIHKRLSAATSPTETATLERQLHIAEVDLNYILHYPAHRKYVALYHNDGDEDAKRDAERWHDLREKGEPSIWKEIERRLGTQTLLNDWGDEMGDTEAPAIAINEGLGPKKKVKKAKEKPRKADTKESVRKTDRGRAKPQEDANISDGGFFEE
ncbi:MAG: 18S rRNA maturation protein [Geoglossum umbratile]|nr:MAG: 18S rRNA maturation protein [Geoglossum umbratile]